jgi:hypothetical protein
MDADAVPALNVLARPALPPRLEATTRLGSKLNMTQPTAPFALPQQLPNHTVSIPLYD